MFRYSLELELCRVGRVFYTIGKVIAYSIACAMFSSYSIVLSSRISQYCIFVGKDWMGKVHIETVLSSRVSYFI